MAKKIIVGFCIVGAVVLTSLVVLGLGLGLGLGLRGENEGENQDSDTVPGGNDSAVTGENSGTYRQAAVATDAPQCSVVGADILRSGGSAVDAAIASLLCVGVINFHSTGIGGGGFMVFYNATSKTATSLDYRETAPGRANSSMFEPPGTSKYGGLAIAVPGELRGLELAHKNFGRLSWEQLFQPAADIADNGFTISSAIEKAINERKGLIQNYPGMKQLLAPDGVWLKEGDTIYRKKYAQTLRDIGASGGASYFYEGDFLKTMVQELRENGAILEEGDFLNYTAIEREPVESEFDGLRVIGTPPPSSGAVLALILNILQGYDFQESDLGCLAYHRIVEAFKFAFGQRLLLGDPAFNSDIQEVVANMLLSTTAENMRSRIQDTTTHDPSYYSNSTVLTMRSDHGTTYLSVLAPNGDAVAATSTINQFFGSLIRSETSGVIFNDEMDDFAIPTRDDPTYLPPTVPNYIEPGKRPQSSTTPTILLDDGDQVKMVVGASGGTRITTATAQIILDVLNFGMELSEAISYPRLHHQLYPNIVKIEKFPQEFVEEGLRNRGHEVKPETDPAVVQGILRSGGYIHATSDYRKGGIPDGF